MLKISNQLLLLSLLLFIVGCDSDKEDVTQLTEEGVSAAIHIKIGQGQIASAQTRAASNENTLTRAFVFVYDKSGNLYSQKFVTINNVIDTYTIDMGMRSGSGYSIYVIANHRQIMNEPDMGNGPFSYEKIKTEALLKEVTYRNSTPDSYPMTMVGSKKNIEIHSGVNSVDIPLYRISSKVTLNMTAKEGITIKSYQVFSLPAQTYIIPRSMDTENEEEDVAGGDDAGDVDYAYDWVYTTKKTVDASTLNASFYTFENRQGVNENITLQKDKNAANAPKRATYVKVIGETRTQTIVWKFYLGGNPTTNFNIKRNCDYVYNVMLSETETDSRVTMFPTLVGGNSNCYMVKPGGKVSIPVERANESPLEMENSTYNLISDTYYQLMTSTPWKAELIWESSPGLVALDNADKTGNGPLHSFSVTATNPSVSGNAVVGIRNTVTNDILWSWHVWVTDYDGTERFTHNNGKRDWTFMDRALGATSITVNDLHSAGLLYQWGRKDPFPGVGQEGGTWQITDESTDPIRVYDATGNAFEIEKLQITDVKPNNFTNAIRNPATLYYNNSRSYDWFALGDITGNSIDLWNGGDDNKTTFNMPKSVFDPCPKGWRVPIILDGVSPVKNLSLDENRVSCNNNPWSGIGTRFNRMGGDFIGTLEKSFEDNGKVASLGRYWLANIEPDFFSRYSYFFFFTPTFPNDPRLVYSSRSSAIMVRCIEDKEYLRPGM